MQIAKRRHLDVYIIENCLKKELLEEFRTKQEILAKQYDIQKYVMTNLMELAQPIE